MTTALAMAALVLAAFPCALFLLNLRAYRPVPKNPGKPGLAISVLIPARNEEANIASAIQSVLSNRQADFEVIILDDGSADRTAHIVRGLAARDLRVRLASVPALPDGWCGKQHACFTLARLARHPLLLFMDADVRLSRDALGRLSFFMENSNAALASGVPRQWTGSFGERLLIPLIHFILLGFLPIAAMRRNLRPSMSAGCGQLFVARRDSYAACGGHSWLRESLHDGLQLPRVFRRAGFATDLFDATDLAACRMYRTSAETWRGLGRNANEALAAPGMIVPATLVLAIGQVAPFILLTLFPSLTTPARIAVLAALLCVYLPRLAAMRRFAHPAASAVLHPLGVLALLAIQWHAFTRRTLGKPSAWKGRSYACPSMASRRAGPGLEHSEAL
jgi:hypothetical protein